MSDDAPDPVSPPEAQLNDGYTIWITILALLGLAGVGSLGMVMGMISRSPDGDPSVLWIPVMVWAYAFLVTAPLAALRLTRWRHAASATFVHSLVMIPLNCLAVPGLIWIFTGLRREREWQRGVLSGGASLEREPGEGNPHA